VTRSLRSQRERTSQDRLQTSETYTRLWRICCLCFSIPDNCRHRRNILSLVICLKFRPLAIARACACASLREQKSTSFSPRAGIIVHLRAKRKPNADPSHHGRRSASALHLPCSGFVNVWKDRRRRGDVWSRWRDGLTFRFSLARGGILFRMPNERGVGKTSGARPSPGAGAGSIQL
jgi:hypothetical protein